MLNILELSKILNAEIYQRTNENNNIEQFYANTIFESICTDSRKLEDKCLFIALKGDNFDAHDFIHTLDSNKITAILVNKKIENTDFIQIIVDDTKKSLQKLANYWRQQFNIPIIGVVGSNGKTTVKEMIYSILNYSNEAIATQGNLNNDIGLPLSILKLNKKHKYAVFEIGMNHPQETILLANILQPSIAIINNAQREHLEFMQSIDMVATEHGYLLEQTKYLKHAILPHDSEFYTQWASQCIKNNITITSFGFNEQATVHSLNANTDCKFNINIDNTLFNLQVMGLHNASNALAAIAVAKCANIDINLIKQGLEKFTSVKGRLQKANINFTHNNITKNITVINDTYNANPDSVKVAIDVLSSLEKNTLLVLGDMGEVGENGAEFHKEIGVYAKQNNISDVYTLGNLCINTNLAFNDNNEVNAFTDIQELLNCIQSNLHKFNTILVKGSRFMKMERVVEFLLRV